MIPYVFQVFLKWAEFAMKIHIKQLCDLCNSQFSELYSNPIQKAPKCAERERKRHHLCTLHWKKRTQHMYVWTSSACSPRYWTWLPASCIAMSPLRRSFSFHRARGILTNRNVNVKNKCILGRKKYYLQNQSSELVCNGDTSSYLDWMTLGNTLSR